MEYMRSPTEENCVCGQGGGGDEDNIWLYACKMLGICNFRLQMHVFFLRSIIFLEKKILPCAVLLVGVSYAIAAITLYV